MFSLLALIACVNDLPDDPSLTRTPPQVGDQALSNARHPTSGNTLAQVDGYVFTLNVDAGTLTRVAPDGSMQEMDLGAEPSHLAQSGTDLYITLRGERAVVKVDARAFGRIDGRVEVGAEPVGIVAREDGDRIYVAASLEDTIVELDRDLKVLARFPVEGQPKFVALHPSGATLYIGLGKASTGLVQLDLVRGETSIVPFPATTRGEAQLEARVSGDPAVTPDGRQVVVPVLYADTTSPIPAIGAPEDVVPPEPFEPMPYGGKADSVGRVTPSVVEIDVDARGRADDADIRAIFVGLNDTGSVTADFDGFGGGSRSVVGYISHLTVSPDSEHLLASMEGASLVALIDRDAEVFAGMDVFLDALPAPGGGFVGEVFPPDQNGFFPVAAAGMISGSGVSGALFTPTGAVANSSFDAALTELDLTTGRMHLEESVEMMVNVSMPIPAIRHRSVSASVLDAQVALGRRLFFSTSNASMGAGGVSCSTCHVDGRTDGFTWTFDDGPRQTPSLAGRVSDTAPVTWRSNVASVRDEADITTRGRMGGDGLNDAELDAVASFVDWTRLPDTPLQGIVDASIERGALVYAARCSSCHGGRSYTDNEAHAMRGLDDLNTPSLLGVAASAPYLHDGSAATLRDVIEVAAAGDMGPAANLTETEKIDLERFLRTL